MTTHLTTKELAERLHRKPQTLANWRVLGEGPGFIPGRPVLYPLAEVEAWERANVVRGAACDTQP
jgi:hypothetical protein